MSELKKCPFCGGEATVGANEYYDGANTFYIYCASCGVQQTTTKIRTDEAIAAWNRRAQPENSRQHALQTGICPMCEDCPDGCPVETPHDSRNKPENEPIVRCGECIHFEPYGGEEYKGNCNELVGLDSCMYEDDYCSYGERKPERSEG